MARDFAQWFYNSKAWQRTREAYAKSKRGLCEDCFAKGIIKAGEIVHHKTPITPANINDPEITMSFDNLRLLCRDCHAKQHDRRKRRFKVDEMGRVST